MAKKPRAAKSGDIVLVRWLDSCTFARRWQDPAVEHEYGPAVCWSVGRLGRNDKETIVLVGSWALEEIGDVSAIPASCVQSIEVLKPGTASTAGPAPKENS